MTLPQEPKAGPSRDIPGESIVIIGHRALACYCLWRPSSGTGFGSRRYNIDDPYPV